MVSPVVDQKLTFSFLFLSHLQTVEVLLRILPLAGGTSELMVTVILLRPPVCSSSSLCESC